MFEVQKEKCNECLFTGNKIVSDSRKRELLKSIPDNGNFSCHKSTIEGKDVCCRGFFDSVKNSKIRMAEAFEIVSEVE